MALPTFSQLVTQMINFIKGKRPSANTNVGTTLNDIVIGTVANQLSAQDGTSQSVYSSLLYDQQLQAFVDNAAILVPSDLDAIGNNYSLTRENGTQSIGTETFRIRNYTTSSPIITVSAGTTISTLATTSSPAVSFSTTATVTFNPSNAPQYFNPNSGYYEQKASIICQTIGSVGDVPAATITSLVSSVPGIDTVTNGTSTTGGTDIESNTAFANRIAIKLSGNNVGTSNGIISLVNTNPNVIQSIVVGPNDPEMQRNQFGGSVDVYIRGQIPSQVTDTNIYTLTGSQSFVLNHQPALSIGPVIGVVNGVSGYNFSVSSTLNAIPPATDAVFVENPNSLFAGSTEAGSYLQWHGFPITVVMVVDGTHLQVNSTTGIQIGDIIRQGANIPSVTLIPDGNHLQVTSTTGFAPGPATVNNLPDSGFNFTIQYTYDSLIETLQALINNPSNNIVASDILIREAIEAFITVSAAIVILPGYVPATVQANVATNLTNFINALGLGAVINLSELVVVIETTPGVSEVDLSTLTLQSTEGAVTTTIPPGQKISVGKNAYTFANPPIITIES